MQNHLFRFLQLEHALQSKSVTSSYILNNQGAQFINWVTEEFSNTWLTELAVETTHYIGELQETGSEACTLVSVLCSTTFTIMLMSVFVFELSV